MEEEESVLVRNMRERGNALRQELTQQALDARPQAAPFQGARVPAPFTKMPTLNELPEFIQRTKVYEREQQQKLDAARRELAQMAEANAVESRKVGFDSRALVADANGGQAKGPPTFDARA
jgi:hypothetical protein